MKEEDKNELEIQNSLLRSQVTRLREAAIRSAIENTLLKRIIHRQKRTIQRLKYKLL